MSLSYYSFNPQLIPWQYKALQKIANLNYSLGTHEIGLCGILGSAKTTLAAWLVIDHCCKFRDAKAFIGRRSYTDLKETSFSEISNLIVNTWGTEAEKWLRVGDCSVHFPWGARIIGGTWGDGRYEKYKSKVYSYAWLEEPTENSAEEYEGFLNIFRPRVGRISNANSDVEENAIIFSFNAHDPEHPIYEDFYEIDDDITHLFESKEKTNPFLHERYYENLLKRLDPLNVRRQLENEWVSATTGAIYHAYDPEKHYKQEVYEIDPKHPIHIGWDFNIGDGKPLSVALAQHIDDHFHFFDEVIIEGIRTEESCEELSRRGYFNHGYNFILNGDATGRSRDTRSKLSDWLIIRDFFNKHKMKPEHKLQVPRANPAIRKRHNTVNSYMQNGLGEYRMSVYKKCKTLNKGFKMTAFKKGSSIEDDSKYYQHVTTSAGYLIASTVKTNYEDFNISEDRW